MYNANLLLSTHPVCVCLVKGKIYIIKVSDLVKIKNKIQTDYSALYITIQTQTKQYQVTDHSTVRPGIISTDKKTNI